MFHSASPSKGAVTQSVVSSGGLDGWWWGVGKDLGGQATQDTLMSRLWIWNRDNHNQATYTWPGGHTLGIATAYYVSPVGSSSAGD